MIVTRLKVAMTTAFAATNYIASYNEPLLKKWKRWHQSSQNLEKEASIARISLDIF